MYVIVSIIIFWIVIFIAIYAAQHNQNKAESDLKEIADTLTESSWKCPKCGTENSLHTNKCVECGYKNHTVETTKIQESSIKAIKGENNPWTCESCGTLNSSESKICAGCGLRRNITSHNYSSSVNNNSDTSTLAYSYKDVKLCIIKGQEPDLDRIIIGDTVTFIKEPQNQYDKKAVAAYCNNQKIGYVYRGTGQDMTNDYLSSDCKSIRATISKIENNNIYYNINYYKESDNNYEKSQNHIEIRLVRNTKEEIQDYIALCSPGDEVDIDFDDETCLYEVTEMGETIGYIPDKKSNIIDDLENFTAEISDIYENDNGKLIVKVRINY